MSAESAVPEQDVRLLTEQLIRDAGSGGYHINPDMDITLGLVRGLMVNEQRYGYRSCPCRLASGNREDDLDIVCPCNYRDVDVEEYGSCYCGLYVSQEVVDGKKSIESIPERRPGKTVRDTLKAEKEQSERTPAGKLPLPVWRCRSAVTSAPGKVRRVSALSARPGKNASNGLCSR
jgi:ferredoxin-thioredoxin reductase catalytic subunit